MLGINRNTLRKKLVEHGLASSEPALKRVRNTVIAPLLTRKALYYGNAPVVNWALCLRPPHCPHPKKSRLARRYAIMMRKGSLFPIARNAVRRAAGRR